MSLLLLTTIVLGALACLLSRPGTGQSRAAFARRTAAMMLGLLVVSGVLQSISITCDEDICATDCPDDFQEHHCLPNCHSCVCGSQLARIPTPTQPVTSARLPAPLRPVLEPLPVLPSPPLHEIFRPPIA